MISDLNLNLQSGGFHHCTAAWSAGASARNRCYKLYIPVKGEAFLVMNDRTWTLRPGHAYLINGFNIQRQVCRDFMDVYWVHFFPESLFFNYCLSSITDFCSWRIEDIPLKEDDYALIPRLFENPGSEDNRVAPNASLALTCKITSILLDLIGDLVECRGGEVSEESYKLFLRLKPAIDFMNSNLGRKLTLKEISGQVNLSPVYFQKLFKAKLNITPYEYLLEKRLYAARRCLSETDRSISEIADALGFCNQFHFSRTFKRYFLESPSRYRTQHSVP